MRSAVYAVLDVETTHGDPRKGSIMEVGVVLHDGEGMRGSWSSLVRPEGEIPSFIRKLTGITPAMVKDAPRFVEVARELMRITEDRVVVAHNVRYDMTSLEHEFARTGLVFHRPVLCTEQLSRQLVPGLQHYNLGSLCRFFGIRSDGRHRALNDAHATMLLHRALMERFGEERCLEACDHWPRRQVA